MAPTQSSRRLACLAAVATLVAGCAGGASPETDVAGGTADAPTSAVGSETPWTPSTPDLSGNVIDCARIDEPCEPGDDPALDELWDACAGGEGRACDRLYYDSAFDTRYEQFGNTCGDRDVLVPCPDELG